MPDYLQSRTSWVLFFGCLATTALLIPVIMRLARRMGAVDRAGYRRIGAGATPLLGGLAIAIPLIGVCFLGIWGPTRMLDLLSIKTRDLAVLAFGCATIAGLGVIDDTRGIRARYKLAAQIVIALIVSFCGSSIHAIESMRIPFIGIVEVGLTIGTVLTIFWLVGLTNAFNIVDGLDGLSAGIALIAVVGLGIIAGVHGETFVVVLCLGLAGCLLAFLPFNIHPARMFLGDTGSMLLGFALASIALMGSHKTAGTVVFLAPFLALGLPISETLVSMLRRLVRGQPVFAGDSRHTHHRLLQRGFSQRQAVAVLYAGSGICAGAAVFSCLSTGVWWGVVFPIAIFVATMLTVGWVAGYFRSIDNLRKTHQRNSLLTAFSRYARLSLSADRETIGVNEVLDLARRQMELSFLEVGYGDAARDSRLPVSGDDIEEITVTLEDGRDVLIRYRFGRDADEHERHGVAACLAGIFDQLKSNRSLENGLPSGESS